VVVSPISPSFSSTGGAVASSTGGRLVGAIGMEPTGGAGQVNPQQHVREPLHGLAGGGLVCSSLTTLLTLRGILFD